MNHFKKLFFVSLVSMGLTFSSHLYATCYVSNGNNSGTGSLRDKVSKLNDNSNNDCLDGSNYVDYLIEFLFDSNGDGRDDWDTVSLESGFSITNTSRTMIIGNPSPSITIINARDHGMTCIFSVSSSVDLTLKNLEILVDSGVSEDDVICGSGASGVELDHVTVEPAEDTEDGDDTSDDGWTIQFDPHTLGESLQNWDWDRDGYSAHDGDCAPTDSSIYPGATEICDGIDNNCDGEIDEELTSLYYYEDSDGDGYGDATQFAVRCSSLAGEVEDNTDCDDSDARVNPDSTLNECDGTDYNCDGVVDDEGCTSGNGETDGDGDGYCEDTNGDDLCDDGSLAGDCNDSKGNAYPGATEVCDGYDNDCDGNVDEGDICAPSVCEDGSDPVVYYYDGDADGYGNPDYSALMCEQPANYVVEGGDCGNTDKTTYPGADEICDDGEDNNCDGEVDEEGCITPSLDDQPPDSGGCGCDLTNKKPNKNSLLLMILAGFASLIPGIFRFKNYPHDAPHIHPL